MNPYSDGHVLRIRLFRMKHGITLREVLQYSGSAALNGWNFPSHRAAKSGYYARWKT